MCRRRGAWASWCLHHGDLPTWSGELQAWTPFFSWWNQATKHSPMRWNAPGATGCSDKPALKAGGKKSVPDWFQREFLRTIRQNWKCCSIYFFLEDEIHLYQGHVLFTVCPLHSALPSKYSRDHSCPKNRQESHGRKLTHPEVTDMGKFQRVWKDCTTELLIQKDLQTDVTEEQTDRWRRELDCSHMVQTSCP